MSTLVKLGLVVACVVAACSSSKDALFDDGGAQAPVTPPPVRRPVVDPCDGAGTVVRDGALTCNFGEGGAAGSGGGVAGAAAPLRAAGARLRVAAARWRGVAATHRAETEARLLAAAAAPGPLAEAERAGVAETKPSASAPRPYECVRSCGGPIESNSCCQCQAPLFDNYGDIACRDMGTPTVTYAGCRYYGDLGHVTIAKRDVARDSSA